MGTYVGIVNIFNNVYANFKPLYRFDKEKKVLTELSFNDRRELLPEAKMQNINFYFQKYSGHRAEEYFVDGEAYVFEFDTSELELNYNGNGYRIDVSNIIDTPKLQPVSEIDLYYLIKEDDIEGDYRTDDILYISDNSPFIVSGLKVVLELHAEQKTVLGPFEIQFDNEQHFIDTTRSSNKYIIPSIKFPMYYTDEVFYKRFSSANSQDEYDYYYVHKTSVCKEKQIDLITDELLLEEFKSRVSAEYFHDGKLDLGNVTSLMEEYKQSYLTGDDLPDDIKKNRLNRLYNIITNEEKINETFSDIADVFAGLLIKYQKQEQCNEIIEQLFAKPEMVSKIQGLDIVTSRVEKEEEKLKELQQQQQQINEEISKEREQQSQRTREYAESLSEAYEDQLIQKRQESERLDSEIKEKSQAIEYYEKMLGYHKNLEELQRDIAYKETRKYDLTKSIEAIDKQLDAVFADKTETAVKFAFDGMLSNRLLRQAAEWENEQGSINFQKTVNSLAAIPHSSKKDVELIENIIETIQRIRPEYSRNTILNIMICYSQSFLTVLSGEPGTGKTSICRILAAALGLTHIDDEIPLTTDGFNPDRFISVAVERGWTTKRDFVGYYNPLSKTFDRSNRQIFDALNILDLEACGKTTDLPFIILLDEANLSSMEYYWADFMNICDNLGGSNLFNLGNDFVFRIPDSLRFLATINNDHTTEALSPRLIDRAWIIRLPKVASSGLADTEFLNQRFEHMSWSAIDETFNNHSGKAETMMPAVKEVYDNMITQFRSRNINVSPRMDRAMRRYWTVAHNIFEAEKGNIDSSIVALDYAFSQKVLPHINGSGEKYGEKLKTLAKYATDRNLKNTASILNEIIQNGEDNMLYYQYFA